MIKKKLDYQFHFPLNYLGSILTNDNDIKVEIDSRLKK